MYPESGDYTHPPGTPDCDIDASEAWEIQTDCSQVVLAVLDTGVDYQHRDLVRNIRINESEFHGISGHDDDENGYVDDIYGYDFVNQDGDPMDDNGHGTHCAGILAAEGDNGLDIVGVCWQGQIMVLKILDRDGYGDVEGAVTAIYYGVDSGVDVMSNSWGPSD
jgi:subtilisin family serine protease